MAIRISRYIKDAWLRKQDVAELSPEQTATRITRVYTKRIQGEERLIVAFDKVERHLPLNQANLQELQHAVHGVDDASEFVGLMVDIYVDESVEYQGEIVGGIRLEAQEKARPAKAK